MHISRVIENVINNNNNEIEKQENKRIAQNPSLA